MSADRYKQSPNDPSQTQIQERPGRQDFKILINSKEIEQQRIANIADKTQMIKETQKIAASQVLEQSAGIEMIEAKFDKTKKETEKAQKIVETIKKEAVEETSGLAGQAKILGVLLIVILLLWIATR